MEKCAAAGAAESVDRGSVDAELRRWCGERLGVAAELQALRGDAGFRRYFRVLPPCGWLAVHAPPDREKIPEFLGAAALFRAAGARAPQVRAVDAERGFLLVEDFGDELFLRALKRDRRRSGALYRKALELLARIQSAPREFQGFRLPAYDEAELRAEMALFRPWFVERLLDGAVRRPEREMLEKLFGRLAAAAQEGPQVPVHRDYHSRNLLLLENGELGTIDFQDAAWGSDVYDLASLLKDCYVRWPRRQLEAWAEMHRELAGARGLDAGETREDFLRRFDLTGFQRHLKVMGIFARLHLRDGKSAYLRDLPRVIACARERWELHPELADFGEWFDRSLAPRVAQQSWARQSAW